MSENRIIVLVLDKIFNWNNFDRVSQLQISFLSKNTKTLILKKITNVRLSKSDLILNLQVKITYPMDENAIILQIGNTSTRQIVKLAQIQINLDTLHAKKIQFYPFGENDKVLQISSGTINRTPKINFQDKNPQSNRIISLSARDKFIREKQEFLKKVQLGLQTKKYSSNSHYDGNPIRKTPSIQSKIKVQNGKFHSQYQNQINTSKLKNLKGKTSFQKQKNQQTIYKPMHNSYSELSIDKNRRNYHKQVRFQEKRSSLSNASDRSLKRKLILRDLQVVPIQNEYYQLPSVNQTSKIQIYSKCSIQSNHNQ